MGYVERVAAEAAKQRPARLILSLLALPFYVAGFLVGLVATVVVWSLAAAQVGWADAKNRRVNDA